MKKLFKAVIFISVFSLISSLFSGCRNVLDGNGMVNKGGLLESLLTGYWESSSAESTDERRWLAVIEHEELLLILGGTNVLECGFSPDIPKEFNEYNTDVKTVLIPETRVLGYEKTVIGTAELLYIEKGKLYLQITYQNGGTGTVVFEKTEKKAEVLDGSDTYVEYGQPD